MQRVLFALALSTLFAVPRQEEALAPERYPAVRNERVLRFYNLKGGLELGELLDALAEAEFELAYGPKEAASRPSNSVVGILAPVDTKPAAVERALRKAGVKTEALEVFLFRGRVENGFPTFGLGLQPIDYMLGMSGSIRWCDMVEEWTQFYCVAGELDQEKLEGLWQKLQRPLGEAAATLGELARESFVWVLPEEVEAKRAAKLVKALLALDGVVQAHLDGRSLSMTVELANLSACGPAAGFASGERTREDPPRATFSTVELWDLLVKEGLTPVAARSEAKQAEGG